MNTETLAASLHNLSLSEALRTLFTAAGIEVAIDTVNPEETTVKIDGLYWCIDLGEGWFVAETCINGAPRSIAKKDLAALVQEVVAIVIANRIAKAWD
jgi:hypothetical protein